MAIERTQETVSPEAREAWARFMLGPLLDLPLETVESWKQEAHEKRVEAKRQRVAAIDERIQELQAQKMRALGEAV